MKVSFNQPYEQVKDTNGYGYAAKMCKQSLVTLGHEVGWRDASADVEINFIQPEHWEWTGPYRIGYLPWESTTFRPGWAESMNSCDEMWTPSPWVAGLMSDAGVNVPIKVYEHGVDPIWSPVERKIDEDVRFQVFHHGAEALRKGGNETIRAFQHSLWDKFATLNLKMILDRFNIFDTEHLAVMRTYLSVEDLVALYHRMDLLCYPSWGEGFGLAPLQCMATGMPVLVTDGWAPYQRLLGEENLIKSELTESPWQDIHPGQMFKPNEDDIRDKLLWHYNNREYQIEKFNALASTVHEEYDWVSLTRKAFAHLN